MPYGLFLSGGIDSSALLALMRRATGSRIQALTVGWEGGGEADESFEAERLARIAGADCERLTMTARDFWSLAPRIAAAHRRSDRRRRGAAELDAGPRRARRAG